MSAGPGAATERLSRALVRLLPRSVREDYGEPMVQLAKDRRRHGGEPIWRLWPSLVVDAVSTTARTHWEEAMPRVPAVFIGLIFAIAAFAVLSAPPPVRRVSAASGGGAPGPLPDGYPMLVVSTVESSIETTGARSVTLPPLTVAPACSCSSLSGSGRSSPAMLTTSPLA